STMCSYWRSRLALQAFCGMRSLLGSGEKAYPERRELFDRLVLDVVLGRVRVREVVDHVRALRIGVVDLHERLPLRGQRVLREDRLDRALRLAGPAVVALLRDDEAETIRLCQ